jgi:hypothetical protein
MINVLLDLTGEMLGPAAGRVTARNCALGVTVRRLLAKHVMSFVPVIHRTTHGYWVCSHPKHMFEFAELLQRHKVTQLTGGFRIPAGAHVSFYYGAD